MSSGQLSGTSSLLCCYSHLSGPSSTSFHSGFPNRCIFGPLHSNALLILVLFSQIVWIVEFPWTNFRHTSASFFSIFCFSYHPEFSFEGQIFLLFVTVATLLIYQSPVNCTRRKVVGNFMVKALFCDVTQRRLVANYRCFGTTPFKGPAIQEKSVTNHQTTLRNIPGEQRSHLRIGGSLKSWITIAIEEYNPTRCHLLLYYAYVRLNMFRTSLRPSSGAHDDSVVYHIGRLVLELLLVGS